MTQPPPIPSAPESTGASAATLPDREARSAAVIDREARSAAVIDRVAVPDRTPRPESRTPGRRSLGALLRKSAGLSEDALRAALEEQEEQRIAGGAGRDGLRLGEILMRHKSITEEQLLRALGEQFDMQVMMELRPETCDHDLAQRVPINFAKQHRVMPLRRLVDLGIVEVALADPAAVHMLDDVRRAVDAEVEPILAPASQIVEAINKVYSRGRVDAELGQGEEGSAEEAETEEDVDLVDLNDEAPIIRWVNSVIFHAVRVKASDIHLEPREKELMVRYRIDGVLEEYKRAPRNFINSIIARVKIMAGLNIAEKRLPQDGRIRRKIAGKDIDMRVATVPTGFGERITIRLLDRSSVLLDLADIGFGEDHLTVMHDLIVRPHGILLVTGPTGSGKTTTLYAALAKINNPDINIMTVEDPVEYQLEGISQIQVNPKIELTFASAIRSFLRHDPDVIMVGEIRDQETAAMAITASLTGHLVFSTIHTNDSAGAITRLVDMGIEPFLVTSSLSGILAQRLVRRLCLSCRELYQPAPEELVRVGLSPDEFFAGAIKPTFYKAKGPPPPPGMLYRAARGGCHTCNRMGYTGRSAIYELLQMDREIRALALRKADAASIKEACLASHMRTLRGDGAWKVLAGITSLEEVMLVTAEDKN